MWTTLAPAGYVYHPTHGISCLLLLLATPSKFILPGGFRHKTYFPPNYQQPALHYLNKPLTCLLLSSHLCAVRSALVTAQMSKANFKVRKIPNGLVAASPCIAKKIEQKYVKRTRKPHRTFFILKNCKLLGGQCQLRVRCDSCMNFCV